VLRYSHKAGGNSGVWGLAIREPGYNEQQRAVHSVTPTWHCGIPVLRLGDRHPTAE